MSNFTLKVGIDPADLAHIRNMANPAQTLFPFMEQAMVESLDILQVEAESWMWGHFINPQGGIEGAFEKHPYGPFSAELWNDKPYAQRTNYGFNNMTDSLGRYYQFWPGIAWAENAIANSYEDVELAWQVQMNRALGRL